MTRSFRAEEAVPHLAERGTGTEWAPGLSGPILALALTCCVGFASPSPSLSLLTCETRRLRRGALGSLPAVTFCSLLTLGETSGPLSGPVTFQTVKHMCPPSQGLQVIHVQHLPPRSRRDSVPTCWAKASAAPQSRPAQSGTGCIGC